MSKLKADLTQRVINPGDLEYPRDLWCKSGHTADEFMERDGKVQRMRFINISGDLHLLSKDRHGVYCEQCLFLANRMARDEKNYNKF